MLVQIYEVNNHPEAKALTELGVDHLGVLVGKGKFPRELSYPETQNIFKGLPASVKKVALSMSNDLSEIFELVNAIKPDILHLGTIPELLTSGDLKELKRKFPRLKIMRSIPIINNKSVEYAKAYENLVDFLLLDTYREKDSLFGATGEIHDWTISQRIVNTVKIPVILAGGLGTDNIAEAIRKVKPAGVDSKTKTDRLNGRGKDLTKVKEFVRIAKSF